MLKENVSEPAEGQFVCVSSEQVFYLPTGLVCPHYVHHTPATSYEYEMESIRMWLWSIGVAVGQCQQWTLPPCYSVNKLSRWKSGQAFYCNPHLRFTTINHSRTSPKHRLSSSHLKFSFWEMQSH